MSDIDTDEARAPSVVPAWPAYMEVRRSRPAVDALRVAVVVALLAGAAVAYAHPWRSSARAGGDALARYVPDQNGTTSLSTVSDDTGAVTDHETDNVAPVVAAQVVLALPSAVQPSVLAAAAADPTTAMAFTADDMTKLSGLASTFGALDHAEVQRIRVTDVPVAAGSSPERSETIDVRGPGGLFAAGLVTTSGAPLAFSPPLLTVPSTVDTGRTWHSEGTIGSAPYTYDGRIDRHGSYDGPLGHSSDCITVVTHNTFGVTGLQTTIDDSADYCAGLGLVEETNTTTAANGQRTVRHHETVRATTSTATPTVDVAPSPPVDADTATLPPPDGWTVTRFARTANTSTSVGAASSPTFVPGSPSLLLVTDETGDLVAYDATTRFEIWRFHAGGPIYGRPRFDPASSTIVFGAADRRVYALDRDGSFRWSFRTGDNVAASPIVSGDIVVAPSEDQSIYGLDLATGAQRWRVQDTAAIASSPVAVHGLVAVADDDGNVLGIDPRDGSTTWSANLPGPAEGPVTTDGDTLYVGSGGDLGFGAVSAFDAATGEQRWSTQIVNPSRVAVAIGDSLVFAVDDTGSLEALDRTTGAPRWSTNSVYSGAAIARGDTAVAARVDGTIDVFDAAGHVTRSLSSSAAKSPIDGTPSLDLGLVEGGGALWFADSNALVFRIGSPVEGAPPIVQARFVDTQLSPGLGNGPLTLTPVEHDAQAIVVDSLGGVTQVDPITGGSQRVGGFDTKAGTLRTDPVVAGDEVIAVVGTDLQAFDLTTKQVRWTAKGGGGIALAAPVVSGGTVYFATADVGGDGNFVIDPGTGEFRATLRAVDVATGDARWSAPVSTTQGAAVSVSGDTVLSSAPLTAFDAATGAVRWQQPAVASPLGQSAASPGTGTVITVSGGSAASEVVAVDATTGAVRWTTPLPSGSEVDVAQGVVVDGDTAVVATTSPGPLLAFDVRTGAARWQFASPGARSGTILATGGTVYVVLGDGTVLAVDTASGQLVGTANDLNVPLVAFGLSVGHPALVGQTVVVEEGAFVMGLTQVGGR